MSRAAEGILARSVNPFGAAHTRLVLVAGR
jgi:hypothetical protein